MVELTREKKHASDEDTGVHFRVADSIHPTEKRCYWEELGDIIIALTENWTTYFYLMQTSRKIQLLGNKDALLLDAVKKHKQSIHVPPQLYFRCQQSIPLHSIDVYHYNEV